MKRKERKVSKSKRNKTGHPLSLQRPSREKRERNTPIKRKVILGCFSIQPPERNKPAKCAKGKQTQRGTTRDSRGKGKVGILPTLCFNAQILRKTRSTKRPITLMREISRNESLR